MIELDEDESAELAARGQLIVIVSILLNLGLNGIQGNNALPALVTTALGFAVAAWSLLGVVKICSALGRTQGAKLTYMALSFLPVVNLVSLVVLNVGATRLLRRAGWTVGLFGARR
jgi:putative exporter of polyketide antibiotics